MEIVSERTYIRRSFMVGFIPYGKRLDENGIVKDPNRILATLQRVVERGVKRRKGIRGPIKSNVQMDYRTGIPVFTARCRMIEGVPEKDRERLQEWMNHPPQDKIVAGLGEYAVSSNG